MCWALEPPNHPKRLPNLQIRASIEGTGRASPPKTTECVPRHWGTARPPRPHSTECLQIPRPRRFSRPPPTRLSPVHAVQRRLTRYPSEELGAHRTAPCPSLVYPWSEVSLLQPRLSQAAPSSMTASLVPGADVARNAAPATLQRCTTTPSGSRRHLVRPPNEQRGLAAEPARLLRVHTRPRRRHPLAAHWQRSRLLLGSIPATMPTNQPVRRDSGKGTPTARSGEPAACEPPRAPASFRPIASSPRSRRRASARARNASPIHGRENESRKSDFATGEPIVSPVALFREEVPCLAPQATHALELLPLRYGLLLH